VKLIGCVPEAAQKQKLSSVIHVESVAKISCITVQIWELIQTKTYLEVTMSHLNFGAAKNAKNITLTQKKLAVNAIEKTKIKNTEWRKNLKRSKSTGDVIFATIPINTYRIINVMDVKNTHDQHRMFLR
jgi:hypothetical protein